MGVTIPEHFARIARQFPDHEAVIGIPQQRRLTYAQLAQAVDELARGLAGCGFTKGARRIGIWSTNNIEWLLLQMATARIGCVLVNINPAYRPRELAYALKKSEVESIFTIPAFKGSDYVGMLVELLPELRSAGAGGVAVEGISVPAARKGNDRAQPANRAHAARLHALVRGRGGGE